MAKVKNINNTSENKCSCGSWLEHWKKFSGYTVPTYCSEVTCRNKPEVGAHVQVEGKGSAWYIILLCSEHNAKRGETIDVMDSAIIVPANKAETCEKQRFPWG